MTAVPAPLADEQKLQKIVVTRVLDALEGMEVRGLLVDESVGSGKIVSADKGRTAGLERARSKAEAIAKARSAAGKRPKTGIAVTLTKTSTRKLGDVITVAIRDAITEAGDLKLLVDPAVLHIAQLVERTLPDMRRQRSEERIERIVGALVETQDPLAKIDAEVDAANAKARYRFIESFPTYTAEEVNRNALSKARNQHQTASRWKSDGKIFSVPFQGKDRFPAFQFRDGRPLAAIAEVLAALPDEMSPWETAFWFVSTNGWLDDEAPADCLKTPEAVIEAARLESEDVAG